MEARVFQDEGLSESYNRKITISSITLLIDSTYYAQVSWIEILTNYDCNMFIN